MSVRYQVGDLIDISINGARIESMNDVGIAVCSLPNHGWRPTVNLRARGVNVTLTRPRNWPPQPGDLWLSGGVTEWAAAAGDRGRVEMLPLNANTSLGKRTPDSVLNDAPVELVYRKGWTPAPTGAVDQADEPAEQRSAAERVRRVADIVARLLDDGLPLPVSLNGVLGDRVKAQFEGEATAAVDAWAEALGATAALGDRVFSGGPSRAWSEYQFQVEVDGIAFDMWCSKDVTPPPSVAGVDEAPASAAGEEVAVGVAASAATSDAPESHEVDMGYVIVGGPALETDPAALDDLGVAVTGADEVAPTFCYAAWPHDPHGDCPGLSATGKFAPQRAKPSAAWVDEHALADGAVDAGDVS